MMEEKWRNKDVGEVASARVSPRHVIEVSVHVSPRHVIKNFWALAVSLKGRLV